MKEFNDVVALAESIFKVDLAMLELIVVNMGVTNAGDASKEGDELTIRINSQALDLYPDYVIKELIPHEVAHIVNFIRRDTGTGHDQGWRDVCAALGGNPNRTCNLKGLKPMRTLRKWLYRSDCGNDVILSTIRHNKLVRGKVDTYSVNNSYTIAKRHFIQEIDA